MPGIDELKRHALALDARSLAGALRRLRSDEDERAAARAWVLRDRAFFDEVREREPPFQTTPEVRRVTGSGPWMRVMCLVALCPPAEAANAIRWRDLWGFMRPEARTEAAALVAEQPRSWAEPFLTAVAERRLSASEADHAGEPLHWLVEQGLTAHDLPCPEGRTFVEHHLLPGWHEPLSPDRVRQDRLVPAVVYLKIRYGLAAQLVTLDEALPELVEDGTLDRSILVDRCLESLTIETRPLSQRAVAKFLARLELQPSEIPGGLAFLMGVIATRDGAVGAYFLPPALDLVDDADGLAELTRVIAGRKERKQKQVVVRALRDPRMRERVGRDGLLAAVDILASGQEDASLLAELERLSTELGRAPEPEPTPVHAGLWGLTLDPGPPRRWPDWIVDASRWWGRYGWRDYLDRTTDADARTFEFTADQFLRDLAADGPDPVADRCRGLRIDGRLGLNRLVRIAEPAFLAGGLSALWPAVLGVAEDLASSATTATGMPELLRLLTRYAAEVPDDWTLPPALAALAASGEPSKSRMEARALAAALTRTDPTPSARTSWEPTPSTDRVPLRGLWDHRIPVPALPRLLSGEAPRELHVHELEYVRSLGSGELDRGSPWQQSRKSMQLMWSDESLVTTLALEAQVHGVERVRGLVASATRSFSTSPVNHALGVWARGELTAETYWQVLERHRSEGPPLDRVMFAWACEQLVRLPSHPGILSVPSRANGTVAPPRLADEVGALLGVGRVGPIDVLLTLTRLTPGTEDEQAEALDSLAGAELWTDPAVTRAAEGGAFDVVPLLRARIAEPTGEIDTTPFWPITWADLLGPASHDDVVRRVWPQARRFDDGDLGTIQPRRRIRLEHGRLPSEDWSGMLGTLFTDSSVRNQTTARNIVFLANHDGVLDPAITVPVALDRLRANQLPLSGLVDALQFAFERGGLRALWPLAIAVGAAASALQPKPHGLATLLGSLATYAPEVPVPHRVVPPELAALAAAPGGTKSHRAARDLVAILRSETGQAV